MVGRLSSLLCKERLATLHDVGKDWLVHSFPSACRRKQRRFLILDSDRGKE